MKLYAPITYWESTTEDKKSICNGCGAKGGIKVPDTMYGLDITVGCNIHDWMFKYGKTYADMLFANAIFLLNLSIIIINNSSWFTLGLRLLRATKYFVAVAKYGASAYWVDKEENSTMEITFKGEFR